MPAIPSFEEIGDCKTVNCGRGASLSQMNLRVSKQFKLPGTMGIEVFGEVFNMFNAINPFLGGIGATSVTRVNTGTLASHMANPVFMKPTAYAGDAGQPEQRVGQVGFRFVF